jgi:trimethylamine--corrinoid protein Co-methyltransferase
MDTADIMEPKGSRAQRRERAGGREGRRAGQGAQPLHHKVPYIIRNIPTYDIMGEESLLRIEETADQILAEIGIEFRDDPVALEHWKSAGANVDGLLVRFEPGMLREILQSAPASFTQHARNPANNVEIGGKSVVFAPAYGSPFVMDLDKGRRYGTIEDFRNFIKLANQAPGCIIPAAPSASRWMCRSTSAISTWSTPI